MNVKQVNERIGNSHNLKIPFPKALTTKGKRVALDWRNTRHSTSVMIKVHITMNWTNERWKS